MLDEEPAEASVTYYILEASNPKRMLLYSIEGPSPDEHWFLGQRFTNPPEEPVEVEIRTGYEMADLLPFFGTPPLMSDNFYECLRSAGVDNLDVYRATIRSEDGKIKHAGYKAFNLIGVVAAADLAETAYSPHGASRILDASIDSLGIDGGAAADLLMFRLAEYTGAVVVHQRIKDAVERAKFSHVVFRDPADFVS